MNPTTDLSAAQRALLRFLQREGRLSGGAAQRIEEAVQSDDVPVAELLEREGIITEKDLAVLLATTLRLRLIDLTTYPLDPQVARELKEAIAVRYEVVPVRIEDGTIEVAIANPLDLDALKAVEFATGKRVQAVVATRVEVRDALAHAYRLQESLEQFLQHVPEEKALTLTELQEGGVDLRTIAREAELPPVVKLADLILIEGIKSRASDVHVEPGTDAVAVRYRIDGILEESFRFPKWVQNALTARLKIMAKLDITERRVPQDGRIQLRYQDRVVDLRVSSLPAQHGEKITLRILDASMAVHAIERIGLTAPDLQRMRDAIRRPEGLILITGPTGSGKTTTLYALLREKMSPNINIVTIENPIEYQLKGINQVEVNEKQGLTFAGVLRSVLRQDPDVILVGEIRDRETAQIAYQAAQTGHLVLSTVHTNDAAAAVTRLIDLGIEPSIIASATNLLVAQRLVRRVCQSCSAPTKPSDDSRRLLRLEDEGSFRRGTGCPACRQTGFAGRTGVYEVLSITPAIANLIEAGAGETAVRRQARADGFESLLEDARDKVAAGVTTPEELLRVVQVGEQALECPRCQQEIAQDYAACPHCGLVLHATCGSCAKPLSEGWVTCPYCGGRPKRDEASESPVAALSVLAAEEQPDPRQRTYKALVVDDNDVIRDIVRLTLERSSLGLSVVLAQDGNEALELAAAERPDVVLLDLQMPGLDGFEVCRRLRSDVRTAFVPVLMLTAQDSEESITQGFAAGTDDYITKPFRRDDLIARVGRMLERTYGKEAAAGRAPRAHGAPTGAVGHGPRAVGSEPSGRDDAGDEAGLNQLQGTLARLMADREALATAIQACEARLAELTARLDAQADRGAAGSPPPVTLALDEARQMVEQMRTVQERALAEINAEQQAAVGRLEADHRRLAARVEEGMAELARRAESEDERAERLRVLAPRIEAEAGLRAEAAAAAVQAIRQVDDVRTAVAELRDEQVRVVTEARADARSAQQTAEEALRRLEAGGTEFADRMQELGGLQAAIDEATAGHRRLAARVDDGMAELAARVEERMAELARGVAGAEERVERLGALAAGVEAEAGLRAEAATAAAQAARQVDELRSAVEQMRQEQARTMAEARAETAEAHLTASRAISGLEEIMVEARDRRAAFAEIRTAIESLQASQLILCSGADDSHVSSPAPVDPADPPDDVAFGLPGTLIDRLREQIAAFASGAPWTPAVRRMLSLLLDSTLAAVVAPGLRRFLDPADTSSTNQAASALGPPADAALPAAPSTEAAGEAPGEAPEADA